MHYTEHERESGPAGEPTPVIPGLATRKGAVDMNDTGRPSPAQQLALIRSLAGHDLPAEQVLAEIQSVIAGADILDILRARLCA